MNVNLKTKLCNHLLENNLVKEMDVIKHSYSMSRLNEWDNRNIEANNLCPCLTTRADCLGVVVKGETMKKNITINNELEGQSGLIQPVDRKYKEHGTERSEHIEFKSDNCSHALRTSVIPVTCNNLRIRKLTPRECFRLQGVTDEDFDKAKSINSDSNLYKQAGNSIVVNVLEEIFKQLL